MGLSAMFKFAPAPVSVLVVVLYAIVFAAVFVNERTPDVPRDQRGLNLDQAYEDLHRITTRPHPHISHANDAVRDFILSRLRSIAASQQHVHISDDLTSNVSYVTPRGGFYFEGNNILIKIDGTNVQTEKPDGVLFSSHFDSVSTAPGATDDGMGVVTLLQMVEFLSDLERRPRRTAVFFFNNAEEDGLKGAHAYYEHPWSNLTNTFINLEGAAAGGRPIVFRATSIEPTRAFLSKEVPHPHANVLSADGFARGLIRSGTDYSVYAQGIKDEVNGMAGVDLAFYKNRAFYHTPRDSIPGMGEGEGRRSLWAMMENVRGAGLALLNGDETKGDGDSGVYFDLLGRILILFPLQYLFIANIVFLAVGPITILVMLAWIQILSSKYSYPNEYGQDEESSTWVRIKTVFATVMSWGRFWVALAITIGAHIGLVVGYVKLNPFIVHSSPYVVLIIAFTLSYLALVLPLALYQVALPSSPAVQKLAIMLELYFLSWIFLIFTTIAVQKLHVGGLYWIAGWNLCIWAACIIALFEGAVRVKRRRHGAGEIDLLRGEAPRSGEVPPGEHRFVRGMRYEAASEGEEREPTETEPTEITPLMHQNRRRSTGGREYVVGADGQPVPAEPISDNDGAHEEEYGWWIFQMIALLALPALLVSQIVLLLVHALGGTLVDGSNPITVYALVSILSLFVMINLAPFAHKLHRGLTLAVLLVFAIALAYAWLAFPFSQDAPLKVFFQQTVELDFPSSHTNGMLDSTAAQSLTPNGSIRRVETMLAGPLQYLKSSVIPELPSSWGKDVDCEVDNSLRPGLWKCKWESNLLPSPGGHSSEVVSPDTLAAQDWIDFNATRLTGSSALISLKGTNTRTCHLYFDHPVTYYHVHHVGSDGLQPGYEMPEGGVKELTLSSRTWSKEFVVEVGWVQQADDFKMEGRAACEWAEYSSASAGMPDAASSGQIPALEEVLDFAPLWATTSKWTDGLVEAWTKFSV